jgi:hypothetical protein
MRHYILLISLTACCITASSQTTEREYKFITKGYGETLVEGLDIIKGYSLINGYADTIEFSGVPRRMDMKYLIRQDGTTAGAIYIHQRLDSPGRKIFYECIPHRYSNLQMITQCEDTFTAHYCRGNSDCIYLYRLLVKSVDQVKFK